MTPLRQRLVDDLRLRNYSPRTIEIYVAHVARFAKHFGRSPDLLGAEEMRAFQLHLLQRQVSWSQFNQTVCALRFFYGKTLGRSEQVPMLPYGKKPHRLPCVLSPEEVASLLEAARPGRERMLLQTAYACGLRLMEVLTLQVSDIDSARMLVQVRQGKGNKDRWCPCRPDCWPSCAPTGARTGRRHGCLPIRRSIRCIQGRCNGSCVGPCVRRACASRPRCTRCGIRTPRTCWRRAWT